MKEIALHILDIFQNSVTAGASLIRLRLLERDNMLYLELRDDGCGMSPEFLAAVTDPFTTSRKVRKVGLGLPLLRLTAEQTGGEMTISSQQGVGTVVCANFYLNHIDCPTVGDLPETLCLLVQSAGQAELEYTHATDAGSFTLDTRQLREIMEEIPLDSPEVLLWIQDYVRENLEHIGSATL